MQAKENQDVDLLWTGFIVEGSLLTIALILAYFGCFDQHQPLLGISWSEVQTAFVVGVIGTIPLGILLVVIDCWTPRFFQPMKKFVDEQLRPLFRSCTFFELLILSVMAGVCEEALFRWSLQGGITWWMEPKIGTIPALAVGLIFASVFFGVCHWVNAAYGITTLFIGAYLGLLMYWTGSWLGPAVVHTLYDFVALVYLAKTGQNDRFTG